MPERFFAEHLGMPTRGHFVHVAYRAERPSGPWCRIENARLPQYPGDCGLLVTITPAKLDPAGGFGSITCLENCP